MPILLEEVSRKILKLFLILAEQFPLTFASTSNFTARDATAKIEMSFVYPAFRRRLGCLLKNSGFRSNRRIASLRG